MSVSEVVSQAVSLTKQVIEAATPIAKQAYEIGLTVIRVNSIGELIIGIGLIIAAAIAGYACLRSWKQGAITDKNREDGDGWRVLGACFGTFSAVGAACAGYQLFSIWNWVGVFAPDLWLAHAAIEKILK